MTFTFDTAIVSDLHKAAHGFRPKADFWDMWEASNPTQKQKIWDDLCDEAQHSADEDARREQEAINDFEDRIALMMSIGATSRKQAIKWIVQSLAKDENQDMEWIVADPGYVCYLLGLPYSMENEFKGL